jgi:hypothetical protein
VTVRVAVAVLPEGALALMVYTVVPGFSPMPGTVQLVVPCAVPLPPLLLDHDTLLTPAEAVPAKTRELLFVM